MLSLQAQCRLGSNGNERVLCILQSSSITRSSPSDCLVSYPGHSLGGVLPCKEAVGVFYCSSQLDNLICGMLLMLVSLKKTSKKTDHQKRKKINYNHLKPKIYTLCIKQGINIPIIFIPSFSIQRHFQKYFELFKVFEINQLAYYLWSCQDFSSIL